MNHASTRNKEGPHYNDPIRFVPVVQRDKVVMNQINKNDVFLSERGLIAKGSLSWNVVFLSLLMQTLQGFGQGDISGSAFITMVVTIVETVIDAGGRFMLKQAKLKFTSWAILSPEKCYLFAARCLVAAVKQKDGVSIPNQDFLITGLTQIAFPNKVHQSELGTDSINIILAQIESAKETFRMKNGNSPRNPSETKELNGPIVAYLTSADGAVQEDAAKDITRNSAQPRDLMTSIVRRIHQGSNYN